MFKEVTSRIDFPKMEEDVLKKWAEEQTFEASLENRSTAKEYLFYDGPPFATGLPHYGHLLAGTIKDIIPRYQTMRGKRVERRFGWDCHGLPIEALAQDALALAGAPAIKEAGVGVFNENVDLWFLLMFQNGKRRSLEWVAGLTLRMTIKQWICLLWSQFGGFLLNYGNKIECIDLIGLCHTVGS